MIVYLRFLWSLLRHKWFVLQAGLEVGCIPLWRLIAHDWSKFTLVEFGRYARWHFSDVGDKEQWAAAWLHHQGLNPHHPEYWLLSWRGDPDFYDGVGEKVADYIVALPMPMTYVREFIADLMGASRAYTGSWDISAWLNREGLKWYLHSDTIMRIASVMIDRGYSLTDTHDWSWSRPGRER